MDAMDLLNVEIRFNYVKPILSFQNNEVRLMFWGFRMAYLKNKI